jgi:hypothetical protein
MDGPPFAAINFFQFSKKVLYCIRMGHIGEKAVLSHPGFDSPPFNMGIREQSFRPDRLFKRYRSHLIRDDRKLRFM